MLDRFGNQFVSQPEEGDLATGVMFICPWVDSNKDNPLRPGNHSTNRKIDNDHKTNTIYANVTADYKNIFPCLYLNAIIDATTCEVTSLP